MAVRIKCGNLTSTLSNHLAFRRGIYVWDFFYFTFPLVLHGAVIVLLYLKKTCLQGRPWNGSWGKRKEEGMFLMSNVVEECGVRWRQKWPWNLTTWKRLGQKPFWGNDGSESLIRVGDVILKNLFQCESGKLSLLS